MEGLCKKTSQENVIHRIIKDHSFAEFFAGIGLMRLGLEHAGWQVRFANDICRDKYAMYSTNFPDAREHFILGDIHAINPTTIPEVTLATASFPCNDLSLAGLRDGLAGKQSSAYWGFISILEEMGAHRPPLVLLENVSGFLTSKNGKDFYTALQALNRLGYCVDAFILDAARFVPQSRIRLFVVGVINSVIPDSSANETPHFYESALRPRALADFVLNHPDINWNLREIPQPPESSKTLESIIEDIDETSPLWWNAERTDYLVNQMSPRHISVLERMMSQKRWSFGTVFRRVRNKKSMAELRTDGIAGCLRTPRGGSGRQILVQAGFGAVKVRLLSPIECARLMGADDFEIKTSLNKALFGFGDAVCVPAVSWIAENYLNPLVEDILREL